MKNKMSQTDCWAWLQEYSPFLFCNKDDPPLLSIGIHKDIELLLPAGFNKYRLRYLIGRWVGREQYRNKLILGEPRYLADGEPSGHVTQDQMDKAA